MIGQVIGNRNLSDHCSVWIKGVLRIGDLSRSNFEMHGSIMKTLWIVLRRLGIW